MKRSDGDNVVMILKVFFIMPKLLQIKFINV